MNITTSCMTTNASPVKLNSSKLTTILPSVSTRLTRSTLCCWTSQRRLTKCPTHFTRSYVATPYRLYHNKSFTTTTLHHSTQACRNRTASSRQHIYHNHTFCHRIRLPSVAYQSDNKTNKPARKHSEKGHAHYILWNAL